MISAPVTMAKVAAELGVSLPLSLTDSRVRELAGKPTGPISLSDLNGKSAMSYAVNGAFNTLNGSLGQVYDRATLSITKSPSTAPNPTAYLWEIMDYGGSLMNGSLTGSTIQLTGPNYDPMSMSTQMQVDVRCRLTVNGSYVYTPYRTMYYNTGLM